MVEELPKLPCFVNGAKFLAYFFCDSSSKDLTTATSILWNLIYQFITQQPQLTRFLLPAYEKGQENLQSFDTLWSILMNIGSDTVTGAKYCIIDALMSVTIHGKSCWAKSKGISAIRPGIPNRKSTF
jgi:hypothetical protein